MAAHTILVVEDEADMARILHYNLTQAGYNVLTAASGEVALTMARGQMPHAVLLDLRLPGVGGLNVLRELKGSEQTRAIAVIVVSALGGEDDVVLGLNLGADDYVAKPFRVRELLARVAAALRRAEARDQEEQVITSGDVSINFSRHEVVASGARVELTPSEFAILGHLARHPGRVATRRQLCDQALRSGESVQERTIDAHVRTIRQKLRDAGQRIETVWGIGYRFTEP